jgi:hypothetical protein
LSIISLSVPAARNLRQSIPFPAVISLFFARMLSSPSQGEFHVR